MDKRAHVLRRVTDFYLTSNDFNGIPVETLVTEVEVKCSEIKEILSSLIKGKEISLNFGDVHPNPHVKALPEHEEDVQVEKLLKFDLRNVCVYPSPSHLKQVVDPSKYEGRPFTLRLALGEPQMSYLSFDLSILEFYRNDPRYYYTSSDIGGTICVNHDYAQADDLAASDKVVLQTFGFSYDFCFNRAVAVFLCYLSGLTPEHQQIWNAKVLKGDFKLHPDYFRTSVMGQFPEGVSIFGAFVGEMHEINEMCRLIGRPALFREEFMEREIPKEFGFLIRPTLKQFNDFVLLLDKMLSENINREFFLSDVPFEYDEVRDDAKVAVRQKGSVQILDEWLGKHFRTKDREPIREMISTFKEIRKLRQRPAHAIDQDIFDQKYFRQQRELIIKAYKGVSLLRLILANHPNVKGYKVPKWLDSKKIWDH